MKRTCSDPFFFLRFGDFDLFLLFFFLFGDGGRFSLFARGEGGGDLGGGGGGGGGGGSPIGNNVGENVTRLSALRRSRRLSVTC